MEKIISNRIQCKHCGEIIESKNVHDFVCCKCGACAVTGGKYYLSRSFKTSQKRDFIELSEVEEADDEKIKANMNRLHKEK